MLGNKYQNIVSILLTMKLGVRYEFIYLYNIVNAYTKTLNKYQNRKRYGEYF